MKSIEDQARAFSKFDLATDIGTDLGSYRQGLFEGFLAGYQAAKPQWISVKDRLPPDGAKVLLIVFGDIHYGWIDQSPSDPTEYSLYFSNTYIDKGHHALTHWMPIPSKPKYMSDYVEYEPPKEEK